MPTHEVVKGAESTRTETQAREERTVRNAREKGWVKP